MILVCLCPQEAGSIQDRFQRGFGIRDGADRLQREPGSKVY